MKYDYCIIGGGIIGLATAINLQQENPKHSILILEKELTLGIHQTNHNSGVIHAGIYYPPKSKKAELSRLGMAATKTFCEEYQIKYESCGKLIVATNQIEENRVKKLYTRALENGAKVELLSSAELQQLEPNITGNLALLSPDTGIVNFHKIALKIAEIIKKKGAEIFTDEQVIKIIEHSDFVEINTIRNIWNAKKLIVCGGLQSDRLVKISGLPANFQVIPFRGEYFILPKSKNNIVKHLIYPAPDPDLPFLGVHLTRMIDGGVTVGPNAVLGWSREGYQKHTINLHDASSFLTYPGFWKFIFLNFPHAITELKTSLFKKHYLAECRKYCPQLELSDLLPYQAGIRAQVVTKNGEAVEDFKFIKTDRMLHVVNAPSPAATAAFPIGKIISEMIANK